MDQKLKSIYYNPRNPAGFSSAPKLAKASGYSLTKVKKWLKAQPTYTLHRQARKRYPTRKYIVHDIDEQWQADLADVQLLASQNHGYRYILTVIDIFSRYAWARPLKTKRGDEVASAFKDIFNEGRIPQRIQTDQGREFENRHVLSLFQEHNIELFSVKSAYKAAIVERFNRTLKHKLWRYFTMSTHQNWTNVLQDIIYSYNHSIHRTLGCKPIDVTSATADDIRDKVFLKNRPSEKEGNIKVGDTVRISKVKSNFEKGYLPNWTEEIFTVDSINRKNYPTSYKLKDYQGEIIEGSFYRPEIESVIRKDDLYVVENVLRTEKRRGEKWCFVKWLGYPSSMNSWVRQSDIVNLTNRQSV